MHGMLAKIRGLMVGGRVGFPRVFPEFSRRRVVAQVKYARNAVKPSTTKTIVIRAIECIQSDAFLGG